MLTIVVIILTLVVRNIIKEVKDISNKLHKNVDLRAKQSSINKGWKDLYSLCDRRIYELAQEIEELKKQQKGDGE